MRLRTIAMVGAVLAVGVLAASRLLRPTRPTPAAAPQSPAGQDGGDPRPPLRTRADLYQAAKRLDIPGRSRMSKAELEQAVTERTSRAALA